MSTPRSTALPPGARRVRDEVTGLATLRIDGDLGTVLLAPGFTGSKEDFLDLMPLLADWTVIALDHRGQYESPRAAEYSLAGWAADLCRIAQTCQPPVHLVGHSLGGLIAGTAASGFDWATVVLLNSGSGPIHASKHDQLRLLISALDHYPPEQIWQVKLAADKAAGWSAPSAEVEEFMHQRFVRTDPASLQEMARILLSDRPLDLRSARGQLLVAFGIEDPDSWSWQTQVDLAARYRARLALIPDAAHSPAVEAPEATAALLKAAFIQPGQHAGVRQPRNGYAAGMQILTPLDADTTAIRRARKTVSDQLWAWGLSSLVDDAELITSELVTNAIAYGRGLVQLRVTAGPQRVRIAVMDGNPDDLPTVATDRGLQAGGRGLALVAQLAEQWGYEVHEDSKEVWAELTV